jgi:hypothetical protein
MDRHIIGTIGPIGGPAREVAKCAMTTLQVLVAQSALDLNLELVCMARALATTAGVSVWQASRCCTCIAAVQGRNSLHIDETNRA